jgi:hypothetical protein
MSARPPQGPRRRLRLGKPAQTATMRPVRVARRPPVADLAGWAILLAVLVGLGAGGRLLPLLTPDSASLPSPTASPTPTPTPDPMVILEPRPGLFYRGIGVLPVRGQTSLALTTLLAEVSVERRVIGSAAVTVLPDGSFVGGVRMLPPAEPTAGLLRLREAGTSGPALATIPLDLQAGAPILIWTPSLDERVVRGERLVVSGPILEGVARVRALLTTPSGKRIAQATVLTRGRETFRIALELAPEGPTGRAWLHVIALQEGSGAEVAHLDIRLTIEP